MKAKNAQRMKLTELSTARKGREQDVSKKIKQVGTPKSIKDVNTKPPVIKAKTVRIIKDKIDASPII
ncbi:hypothetical protein Q4E40_07240 [Pontibacter sp. BT731]|uniref:hypothetical protein n=1 Tax=Pontibacter coccineus TaxID=3063328 RepID=UPI0026E1BFF6|nr:hypothetical protein [Pontibacter sp. BT731]MDO6389916.1 hypothetical protein [Pontibacter sp. BT731]